MSRILKLALTLAMAGSLGLAAAGLAGASEAGPLYLAVASGSATAQGNNLVRLSATANGDVPKRTDAFIAMHLIAGVAWADLDSGTAVVLTIHPVIGRDSFQRPDSWHLHTVRLTGGATAPNDFCLVEVASTPTGGIQIQGDSIRVNLRASEMPMVNGAPLAATAIDAAVGFTVEQDAACGSGLGVRIRT